MKGNRVTEKRLAAAGIFGIFLMLALFAGAQAFTPGENYTDGMVIGGNREAVTSLDFSPDGSILAASYIDGTVILWDTVLGKPRQVLKPEFTVVNSVRYSPDGNLLAWGTGDGMVKTWHLGTGQLRHVMRGHTGTVRMIAFSPEGNQIASAGNRVGAGENDVKVGLPNDPVRLWLVFTGASMGTLQGHPRGAMSVAYSKDGRILASGGAVEGDVIMWNPADQKQLVRFSAHGTHVQDMEFSNDGKLFATCSADHTAKLYELKKGEIKNKATLRHPYAVSNLAFSPDGRILATACYDQQVHLWDTGRGRENRTLSGHTGNVEAVALSRDGKYLASGGFDKTVKLWDPATGRCIFTLLKPTAGF